MSSPLQMLRDVAALFRLPAVQVNLMFEATEQNDPFYGRLVRGFYESARKRHPKFPLFRQMERGVALCPLPENFDAYFMTIEAAARRNFKKSQRSGYTFRRIVFNDHLGDITEIRRSAEVRQGAMPASFLANAARPISDPPSKTRFHDYPYFGVFREGKLVAYAGCLVSGELFLIEQIYGHAAHQQDGIVPMLIISMAAYAMAEYPRVRYYAYGTFFGASPTLRRFKKKFRFLPHRVTWVLSSAGEGRPV